MGPHCDDGSGDDDSDDEEDCIGGGGGGDPSWASDPDQPVPCTQNCPPDPNSPYGDCGGPCVPFSYLTVVGNSVCVTDVTYSTEVSDGYSYSVANLTQTCMNAPDSNPSNTCPVWGCSVSFGPPGPSLHMRSYRPPQQIASSPPSGPSYATAYAACNAQATQDNNGMADTSNAAWNNTLYTRSGGGNYTYYAATKGGTYGGAISTLGSWGSLAAERNACMAAHGYPYGARAVLRSRKEWLKDVNERQRNLVFPDTLRNEMRFWRNLGSGAEDLRRRRPSG